jgi:hypothetical protein
VRSFYRVALAIGTIGIFTVQDAEITLCLTKIAYHRISRFIQHKRSVLSNITNSVRRSDGVASTIDTVGVTTVKDLEITSCPAIIASHRITRFIQRKRSVQSNKANGVRRSDGVASNVFAVRITTVKDLEISISVICIADYRITREV